MAVRMIEVEKSERASPKVESKTRDNSSIKYLAYDHEYCIKLQRLFVYLSILRKDIRFGSRFII